MMRTLVPLLVLSLVACSKKEEPAPVAAAPALSIPSAAPAPSPAPTPTASSSASSPVTDLVVGKGAEATAGKKVTVHYTLWLEKGMKKIESSYDKKKPYSFRVGAGQVIKGWDSGIEGMRVGGKRRLVVPPELGYGGAGSPPSIPGGATLVFEIELLDVKP